MKKRSRAGGEVSKARRRKALKPKRRDASKTASSSAPIQDAEVARLTRELDEAREQQTATSEVLQVISSSPGDLQPVFATMLQNAVRICDAKFGNIYRWDGDALHLMASHNTPAALAEARGRLPNRPGPEIPTGRMIATKTFVHVADLAIEHAYSARDPWIVSGVELARVRTLLVVPMLKENELVGAFTIYRQEVRPFADKQIDLVRNFAAQAVIAIENTRLLNELRESLQQQTATADVLKVISSSPGAVEPVFQALLENATQLCGASYGSMWLREGEACRCVAVHGVSSAEYTQRWGTGAIVRLQSDVPISRAAKTKQPFQIADIRASQVYRDGDPLALSAVNDAGMLAIVAVPMLKENHFVGAVVIYSKEARPFTDKQIELLENFASQAVIAIENARLLNELRQRTDDLTEALEQQTATSEVLQVISSSPGDLQPVFQAMLENAVQICDAKFGNIYRWDGDAFSLVATHNTPPALAEARRRSALRPTGLIRRMVATKAVCHVADLAAHEVYTEEREQRAVSGVELGGARTFLAVPMLKENELIGSFSLARQEVRPFTDKQIELVTNFAAQAVIAIENARLLNELRQRTTDLTERTADLTEALEQQTATSEVLQIISSSPGELEPVFRSLLENATKLCGAKFANLYLCEGNGLRAEAMYNAPLAFAEARRREPIIYPGPESTMTRAMAAKRPVQIADISANRASVKSDSVRALAVNIAGARTVLAVPMLRDDEAIGLINIYRQEVRPFTERQVEFVSNFAAQAVIAIENARLLNELRQRTTDLTERTTDLTEALEQQTATSEVLQVISSSPGDLRPVFETMLENAVRICNAKFGNIHRWDGDALHLMATHNTPPAFAEYRRRSLWRPNPSVGRTIATKTVVHVADVAAEEVYTEQREPNYVAAVELGGVRTFLAVPMLKENELIGVFTVYRQEVRPFTDKQIELVKNFAAQAVIAIENARLLNELRQRTTDLTEALEQQTATSEVLQVVSSSPGDLQPVFDAMLAKAVRICDAKFGNIHRWDGDALHLVASHNFPPAYAEARRRSSNRPSPKSSLGRMMATKAVVHVADAAEEPGYAKERDPGAVAAVELVTEGFDTLDLKEAKTLLDALNAFRNGLLVGSSRFRIGRECGIGNRAPQEIKRLLERAVILFVGRHVGLRAGLFATLCLEVTAQRRLTLRVVGRGL